MGATFQLQSIALLAVRLRLKLHQSNAAMLDINVINESYAPHDADD